MPDQGANKILVVDDNPATLYSTTRVLKSANFEVAEATTGEQALSLAAETPDLVLLDVNLPDIHGFEVCRRLRSNPKTSRLPIVHLSATFVTNIDKVQGLDAGGDGYLTHPIEPPVLIATVNAFLRARKAEDEMHKSELKFKAIFENALSGILLLDKDLTILDINPAICAVLGRTCEQTIGKHAGSYVPAESLPRFKEMSAAIETDGIWKGSLPLTRSDGVPVHFDWYVSSHSFPGVRMAMLADITERIKSESERQELLASERTARAEAERASRLKDEFLGTLSHELRNPLNSILLWTQTLQRDPSNEEQRTRGLDAIERNTRIQSQLIADLLDVSRIVSGKMRLDIQRFDLATTIDRAIDVLRPALTAKGLHLTTSLDASVGLVSGDPSRFQQVMWNLISNAIRFTPGRGEIQVQLRRLDSLIEISVRDNGKGIEPELLPHLFERFLQGDARSNRVSAGLGLGLAIVKHLVEMHGGTVSAFSEGPNKGAQFIVCLPIFPSHAHSESWSETFSERETLKQLIDPRLDGVKVLLVDDNADACDVASRLLRQAGAEVTSALTVRDALAKLEEWTPNVLVSDLGMPERDGFDLIREVRQRGHSYLRLPAIALTALARPEDRRRALLAGYQVHVSKPIDVNELTVAVATLVGRTGWHGA